MKYKTDNIIIRIEPELKAKAQQRAEQQHDSLSRYIVKLIEKDYDEWQEAGMKYIYMREHKDDLEVYESNNLDEVIEYGDSDWHHLTDREKSKCRYAYVIESANPNGLAEDGHYDGDFKKIYK